MSDLFKCSFYALLGILITGANTALAQTGISVSPGRIYYRLPPGSSSSEKVTVYNPSDRELEAGISIADWDYDSVGNNRIHPSGTLKTSCANWVQVMPGSYFTVPPRQQQNLDILLTVPADADLSLPVHTAMLYVTQLNAVPNSTGKETAIRVTIRMGIKIYHSFSQFNERSLDISNFRDITVAGEGNKASTRCLDLLFSNTGKIWLEGKIKWELLNKTTGEKTKLEPIEFYSLPGDERIVRKELPSTLKRGRYNATAIVNYGDRDELKLAELEFDY